MKPLTLDGAREGTVREYRTTDKATWGAGEWQDEPDKVQWIDDATDLDCLIVRGPSGALCGYVGVLPPHAWHGKHYNACTQPEPCGEAYCEHSIGSCLDVHGGLTYARGCQHSNDESRGICHIPLNGRSDSAWWLGFDCAHYGDATPQSDAQRPEYSDDSAHYCSARYVIGEVRSLASQLQAVRA